MIMMISLHPDIIFITIHPKWGQIDELDINIFMIIWSYDAFDDANDIVDHDDNNNHNANLIDIISNWVGRDILDKSRTQN